MPHLKVSITTLLLTMDIWYSSTSVSYGHSHNLYPPTNLHLCLVCGSQVNKCGHWYFLLRVFFVFWYTASWRSCSSPMNKSGIETAIIGCRHQYHPLGQWWIFLVGLDNLQGSIRLYLVLLSPYGTWSSVHHSPLFPFVFTGILRCWLGWKSVTDPRSPSEIL